MPKTIEIKISEQRLREIVAEELARKNGQKITEALDAEGIKTVINASSKLHKALQTFKEDANTALENALGVDLDKVLSTLEHIIQNPGSYTDRAKVEPKRVKLRAVKEEDGLNEGKMNWKPEYKLFMHDLLQKRQKTVPVGSSDTKIADDLQDLGMLKVVKQFKGPSGLVVVYTATDEGKEQFQNSEMTA